MTEIVNEYDKDLPFDKDPHVNAYNMGKRDGIKIISQELTDKINGKIHN